MLSLVASQPDSVRVFCYTEQFHVQSTSVVWAAGLLTTTGTLFFADVNVFSWLLTNTGKLGGCRSFSDFLFFFLWLLHDYYFFYYFFVRKTLNTPKTKGLVWTQFLSKYLHATVIYLIVCLMGIICRICRFLFVNNRKSEWRVSSVSKNMAVNHRNEVSSRWSASPRLRSIYKHNHGSSQTSEFCVITAKLHAFYCVLFVSLLCLSVHVLLTLPSVKQIQTRKQIYLRKVLLIMPVTTKGPHAVSYLSCLCCV